MANIWMEQALHSNVTTEFLAQEISAVESELESTERRLRQVLEDQEQEQERIALDDEEDDYFKFLQEQQQQSSDGDGGGRRPATATATDRSVLGQLAQIEQSAQALQLALDVAHWMETSVLVPDENHVGSLSSLTGSSLDVIFHDAQLCHDLACLLLRHDPNFLRQVKPSLYQEQYLPLYQYVYEFLVGMLKQELEHVRYPLPKGCVQLFRSCRRVKSSNSNNRKSNNNMNHSFPTICSWLTRLETIHSQLVSHMLEEDSSLQYQQQQPQPIVVVELFRPWVERIQFHFLQPSEDRLTSTRTDRLVEWILNYVRDLILLPQQQQEQSPETNNNSNSTSSSTSPWDLVVTGIAPWQGCGALPAAFLQEVIRLVTHVLTERQFFRHASIAGIQSSPLLLIQAMEQMFQFDSLVRTLWADVRPNNDDESDALLHPHRPTGMGLMDTFLGRDDELLQWCIDRERETVFSTLFEDTDAVVTLPSINHVSPRAEIFCALIRSVQTKASLFTVPGPYLRQVAVPLCMQFVDAVHETSNDLKRRLLHQPKEQRSSSSSTALVHLDELTSNIKEWMELINGTHLAALVLLRPDDWQRGGPPSTSSDHDLARFGTSLERFQQVLVEEFAATLVETILMERAKLASYLMMACHLLASETWDHDTEDDLSPELKETHVVLTQFQTVCARAAVGSNYDDDDAKASPIAASGITSTSSRTTMGIPEVSRFASNAMRDQVWNRLADKLLEVALDVHSMTPDIWQQGATIFARDVSILFMGASSSSASSSGKTAGPSSKVANPPRSGGSRGSPGKSTTTTSHIITTTATTSNLPMVLRLLDLVRLMSMDSASLSRLFHALAGLAGTGFLDPEDFSSDGTLYEEAMSMIQAKGFIHLELEDTFSILNRRRDISTSFAE
jgi:hypothetical protein